MNQSYSRKAYRNTTTDSILSTATGFLKNCNERAPESSKLRPFEEYPSVLCYK